MNGTSYGRQPVGEEKDFVATFHIKYEPGTIKAISYDNRGKKVSEYELTTAGEASKLIIELDRLEANADGQSLIYATVITADNEGKRVPFNDRLIKAEVSGAGQLLAFGSARPITTENYPTGEFTTYLGRCQAVIRTGTEPGKVILKVSSEGLGETTAVISVI